MGFTEDEVSSAIDNFGKSNFHNVLKSVYDCQSFQMNFVTLASYMDSRLLWSGVAAELCTHTITAML